ncbi:MAG TPA: 2-oxoacid:ferredoxin oxidoreductase subunit beta [Saprospiraceae bacterium]|nr:2-oxoacid:ferredoxin oxidoreductase subunit beta [Saprospiraceae bacterium]HNT19805.1 2-oxoacid:ferredoxin oxidoreductase subunit beta [Saprospiraceae bacterium]
MTYVKPAFRHPEAAKNKLGYTRKEYEGALSTLCAGCGHDSISAAIVQGIFELSIPPHRVAKLSGIGCSSKTPTYFLGNSHGFNSVHGRMPSVATGAYLANKDLIYLGVSGDGDSASIGMGQFVHAIRRNLNMVYIVMNNGCYGLTKGQDSATADPGSINKSGHTNLFETIDMAGMALELGASFVARSFSGDKEQLIPLIKAAVSFPGFAFIDVISPCVTFNNNKGSTKSYDYVRDHLETVAELDFVPLAEEITSDIASGESGRITMHDGTYLQINKLALDWDPTDRISSLTKIHRSRMNQEVVTGLLYYEAERKNLHDILNTVDTPLNALEYYELCPGNSVLQTINAELR